MKGNETTCLKNELIPLIQALEVNKTLTSIDISGHQASDGVAVALGR